jgi:Concanavalin A-like lectin/glucanases superfamily
MTRKRHGGRGVPFVPLGSFANLSLLLLLGAGCGARDDKFAAQTDDEYTEPLSDVTIGELGKPTVTLSSGSTTGEGSGTTGPETGGVDGGVGTGGAAGAGGFGGGSGGFGPSGFWHFDDCAPTSNFLIDSSGNGANAQHALNGSCVPGISGLGVEFRTAKDVVQVPDEPQFTVGPRVAVAAWVRPTTVSGDQPVVLKRLNNKTAFSLGIHNGNAEFSVVLTSGRTFISRAPIAANAWTHVAGMYDGRFLFLFLNGEQVGQIAAAGTLRNVFAPIRIGATTGTQHFDGVIDDVWLSTNPVSKEELAGLSCIARPASIAVSPPTSGPVPPGTTATYSVTVTNHDIGMCSPSSYEMFIEQPSPFPGAGTGGSTGFGGFSGTEDAGIAGSAGTAGEAAGGSSGGTGGFAGGGTGGSGGSPPTSNDGITTNVFPFALFDIPAGASGTFTVNVTGSEDAEPGVHHLPFSVFNFARFEEPVRGELIYELTEPTGCFVRTKRELMITGTSVVDDPVRTTFDTSFPTANPQSRGVWTFGRLMRDMAPTPEQAPAFTEHLFRTWLTDQTVNGFTVKARPDIQRVVLDNWPKTIAGALDLDRSPLRLQAIVNRIDLRNLAQGNAGEGRFVFGVIGPFGNVEQFTVILEYKLPAQTAADVLDWANRWHALSTHPFPSEEYNAALEALTLRFSGRNGAPLGVNGNALGQLRTNEISLFPHWEFREFALSRATGQLEETTIKLTPDLGFNETQTLGDFVNQNEAAIIAEQHTVPEQFEGAPFLGGSVFNDLVFWNSKAILSSEARHHFSINTCNGCHGPESNTTFLQISPRFPGSEAFLSPFLTGTTVFDPFSGQARTFNDLARRRGDLTNLVCTSSTGVESTGTTATGASATTSASPTTSVTKGIQRVH